MFITNAYASEDIIVVQESEALPKAPESFQSSLTSMVPMVLIFAVIYFLLIRPQDKRRRQHEDLVKGVKKGEEVITSSGIFGVITKVNDTDNTAEIEIAKDVQVKILKSAVSDITSRKKEVVVNKKK